MKIISLTLLMLCLCLMGSSQIFGPKTPKSVRQNNYTGETKVFLTYEDFLNDNGIPFEQQYYAYGAGPLELNYFLKFKTQDGKTKKFHHDEMWGFLYKGQLFRVVDNYDFAMLLESGKVMFWINGLQGMDIVSHDDGRNEIFLGKDRANSFISLDNLNGKIYKMPNFRYKMHDFSNFKKEHPECESLYNCFNLISTIEVTFESIRNCVIEYNKINIGL